MTVTVGMIGAGFMGAGIGRVLREGGARVVTTTAGRSPRTARLAEEAGLTVLGSLDDVVDGADVLLSVVPPDRAYAAATEVAAAAARTHARPLYADLNATSPVTVNRIVTALSGLDVVDGAVSGPPPHTSPGAIVYLSGTRADEVSALPWNGTVVPTVVGDEPGRASAVKMCTASVYKGLGALMTHALATAGAYGVVGFVADDLRSMTDPGAKVALSAAKADRFTGEMLEIAATQQDAGLSPAMFEAIADIWRKVATTDLAHTAPEDVAATADAEAVVRALRTGDMAP